MIKLTTELRETAIAIAQEAGQAIMQIYSNGFDVTLKDDDSPVTAADLAADRVIQQGLRQLTPDLPILSEESPLLPPSPLVFLNFNHVSLRFLSASLNSTSNCAIFARISRSVRARRWAIVSPVSKEAMTLSGDGNTGGKNSALSCKMSW